MLQTTKSYSKATGKSTLLVVCSLDSLQVLPMCSINQRYRPGKSEWRRLRWKEVMQKEYFR